MLSSIALTILASSALASGSVLARQQPPSAGSAIAAVGAQNVPTPSAASMIAAVGAMNVPTPSAASAIAAVGAMNVPTPSAASAIAAVGAMNVPTPSAASMIAAVGAMNVPTNGSAIYYTTYTTSILTTYCPSATVVVQGGKSYTVTEATTLTITDCPCTVTAPASASVYVGTALVQSGSPAAPTGSNSGSGAACASACSAAYDTCRSDPNSPRASCASSYASCLGYSPFDNSGSLVTPTACAASGTATASVYVGTAIYRSGTQAATGTPAMYTGAASMEKPVVGLLALGVAAAFL